MNEFINKRIPIIDILRGLAVFNMVIYHLLYSLVFVFNVDLSFFSIEKFYPYQQYIAWSFILISGFSMSFSRKPLKNGIKVFVAALIVSLVTYIFIKDFVIVFGVLHFLGISIIITSIFDRFLKKLNPVLGVVFSFIVFIIFWKNGVEILSLSEKLSDMNLFFLGFPNESFYSSDYFPLIPWYFLFMTGYFLGIMNKKDIINLESIRWRSHFLEFLSENSLLIYMLHQVVIFICLTILRKIGII